MALLTWRSGETETKDKSERNYVDPLYYLRVHGSGSKVANPLQQPLMERYSPLFATIVRARKQCKPRAIAAVPLRSRLKDKHVKALEA